MMRISERVAIVAGASGGIGAATVRALLAHEFSVVLAAPPDALLDDLVRELEPFAERVFAVPTNITRREEVDALVARTLVRYGRVDVLANCAGIGGSPSFCESSDEELERVLAVNLLGAARLMHAVLPIMKAQRRGSIVTVGSVAGEAGVMGIYSASKFGLRGLCDTVRREVRSYDVDVTLIQPGFVATPMNAAMKNLPGPEIVADAIVAAIERPRRKRIVPAGYRLPVFLVKAFPGVTDLVFGDARVQHRLNRDARAERAARASRNGASS
ncbi:MAG TPA: SDR family NAD(P)-dependent oxidoreductase [Candidatus Elarobacter sp.]|jgi:NAD(P)-dependent dehydrogenase (short-subunit alcohol dehydrogenase family)|nr:SDR family NAD(P)-dependent oxidoreductase [Candidatus Elarobacter sp.]